MRCGLVAALLLVSSVAMAQVPMPFYVVPVVVKAPGASNTNWSTELFVTNLGTQTAWVSAHYFPDGQGNTFNGIFAKPDISLTAGQTLIVRDVVGSWFPNAGANTKGWLFIADTGAINCSDDDPQVAKLAVSARIFNSTGGGATFGQIVEAAWGSFNLSAEATVFTGIRNNGTAKPGSRTSIGVANLSTVPISVEIKLFRSGGALAGTATRQITALSLGQWNLQSLGFPAFSGGAGGRVEVRLIGPNFDPCADEDSAHPGCIDRCAEGCNGRYSFSNVKSFIAYATNVDNLTGDGENMLPVVDHPAFYELMSDHVDANCPERGQFLLESVARRLGLEWSSEPTFRKVVD
jgi:hypothetical protein